MSNPKRTGGANERTPLINGESSSTLHAEHPHSNSARSSGGASAFFLNSKHTPGTDSPNILVRWSSYTWHIAKVTLLSNYVNFLLVTVPIGIIAGAMEWNPTAVFVINFFAIIPLAAVLSFATEEISLRVGESMGGLLNATFGNAVELIVSIVALKDGQIEVVQSSMLGSILSNLLLVMGMCFFFGGLRHRYDADGRGREQSFSAAVAQATCSLMTLSSASLVLPAAVSYNDLLGKS